MIGVGLAMGAIGLAMLTQVDGPRRPLDVLVVASLVISLGLAPVFTLTTDLIVGSAPPERAGAASGISETGAELGGALGIAILGSIGVAIYRRELPDQLPATSRPSRPPSPATPSAVPSPSPGSSPPASANRCSPPPATPSSTACSTTSGLAAIAALGLAVLAVTMLLRDIPSGSAAEAEAAEAGGSRVDDGAWLDRVGAAG